LTNFIYRLFIKDYKNIKDFKVRKRYGYVASIVGIITNILLFGIKIIIGVLFKSIAITADAVNNLSDSASSVITLIGFKISGKPADNKHPYGHARMEYISALIVSFIILFLGAQLIFSSADKILNPQSVNFNLLTIVIIGVSVLAKVWQYLFYHKTGKKINSLTLIATSTDSKNDAFATLAVLASIIITYFTGLNIDGYIGVIVALFIVISGIKLISETISPLLGVAPSKELVESIYKKILSYKGILGIHDLTIHSYGENKCFASVHCEVPAKQDILISHDIIDNIEKDFLTDEGISLVIHLDPIITDDPKTNKLREDIKHIVKQISSDITMHDFRIVWGESHSNILFDIVVPFDFKYNDKEIISLISNQISLINKTYITIITVDHDYTPNN